MILLQKLWAKLTGRNLVALFDFDGEMTIAIERKFASGHKYAYRYWNLKRIVFLNNDGTTSGVPYVKTWKRL